MINVKERNREKNTKIGAMCVKAERKRKYTRPCQQKNRKKDLEKRFTVINAQVRKDSACARKCYAGC